MKPNDIRSKAYFTGTLTSVLACSLVVLAGCASAHKDAVPAPAPVPSEVTKAEKAPMKEAPSANAQTASCTKDSDKRVLEVVAKGSGCELSYTKAGKASVVSSSSQGTTYCEKSLKKVQDKLEKAGFNCQ